MAMLCRSVCALAQTGLVLFALIYPYRERLRYSYAVSFFVAFFYSSCFMTPYFLKGFDPHCMGLWRVLYTCISMFCLSLFVAFLTKTRLSVTVFSVYVIRNMTDALEMAAHFVYFLLIPKSIEPGVFISLLYLLFLLLLEPFLFLFIKRYIKPHLQFASNRFWRYLWVVPFSYYIFFRIFGDVRYFINADFLTPCVFILPFIWFFVTAFSHYIIVNMMTATAQTAALREKLRYSELLAQSQLKEYDVIQDNLLLTRKLRHDMKHHLVVLDGHLNRRDIDSAKNYLTTLMASIDTLNIKPYCQNSAINSILNYFSEKAAEENINVSICVRLGETLPIPDTDFCALLGNLFDNALEACLRGSISEPFITLNIGMTGEQIIVISIHNSYTGEIRISEGKFISSKHGEPGIGTTSIKYMAEKHNGICNFEYINNTFSVSLLLNPTMGV